MRIIEFNALGKPSYDDVKAGDYLIFLQFKNMEIVQLLENKNNSPSWKVIADSEALLELAWDLIAQKFPQCLNSNRCWFFDCPPEILQLIDQAE